jgi:Tol biopolymer transport system component
MNKLFRIYAIFALITALPCYADSIYPDIPTKNLPTIQELPAGNEQILDVRTEVLSGDPIPLTVEVGVYDLTKETEANWDLLHGVPLRFDLSSCCANRASWAPGAKKLFLALNDGAYLIDRSGHYTKLALKMPGTSIEYRVVQEFAVSSDASHVLFQLFARDSGDKYADPADPYAIKLGRMYQDLMYEDLNSSAPKSVARGSIRFRSNGEPDSQNVSVPALSSDRRRIAYERRDGKSLELIVAGIDTGEIIWRTPITVKGLLTPANVTEIRWNPDDTKLGFVLYEGTPGSWDLMQRTELYTIDANGQNLRAMTFGSRTMNVSAFAWSPTGTKFAFRSDFQSPRLCNHNLMFAAQAGFQPCRVSENLFTSNMDGSGLTRVSKEPQYRASQLFWVQ